MKAIIGLGNTGKKYENTYHNIGHLIIDHLAKGNLNKKYQNAEYGEMALGELQEKIFLVKPMGFMNNSGKSIWPFLKFFKIPIDDVIVIHDDLDFEFGKIKFKKGGGSGGHNGIRDIDACISKNYYRLRIGIGRPNSSNMEISDFVLKDIAKEQIKILDRMKIFISDNINMLVSKNEQQIKTQFGQF